MTASRATVTLTALFSRRVILKRSPDPMANDFIMRSGDTKTLEITVKDDLGVIVDISDSAIRWEMARSVNSKTPQLQKTCDFSTSPPVIDGVEIVDGGGGRFNVYLTQDDTEGLRGDWYHEAEIVLPDGSVGTVIAGKIVLEPALIPRV